MWVEECARVCIWASLSVGAPEHSVQHLLSFPPSAVHTSVAANGNMTYPLCSPEHIFGVRNTLYTQFSACNKMSLIFQTNEMRPAAYSALFSDDLIAEWTFNTEPQGPNYAVAPLVHLGAV